MNNKTAIKSFEKLFGCRVSLHDYDGRLRSKCGVSEYIYHKNPFCDYVKNLSQKHLKTCSFFDSGIAKEISTLNRNAIFKICHAGVLEVCVPIFYNGRLTGMIFAGPFYPEKNCFEIKNLICQPGGCVNKKIEKLASSNLKKLSKNDANELLNFAILLASYLERSLAESDDSMKTYSPGEKIEAFLDNKFSDKNANLEMLASFMGLSCSRVSQLLRKLFHKTFSDLLNEKRMSHARYMLKETFLGTVAISANCGYSDSAYFFRVFKIMNNGMTPIQYRKTHSSFRIEDI